MMLSSSGMLDKGLQLKMIQHLTVFIDLPRHFPLQICHVLCQALPVDTGSQRPSTHVEFGILRIKRFRMMKPSKYGDLEGCRLKISSGQNSKQFRLKFEYPIPFYGYSIISHFRAKRGLAHGTCVKDMHIPNKYSQSSLLKDQLSCVVKCFFG